MICLVEDFSCVAQYPVDLWDSNGAPVVTATGWAKVCVKIAAQDPNNNGFADQSDIEES